MILAPKHQERGVERMYTVVELLSDFDAVKIRSVIRTRIGNVRVVGIAKLKPQAGGICVRVEMTER